MSSFQSRTIADGMFSRSSTCHMHVDAGGFAPAVEIARLVDRDHQVPCKAVPVISLVSGPQRKASPDAYAEHHPAHDEDPQADSFASVYLGDATTLTAVPGILETVYAAHPTAVVELEQVACAITWEGDVLVAPRELETLPIHVAGARQIETHVSYEYHHGFNLAKDATQPDLDKLVERLAERGVPFGSIYVFDRGDKLAYRTNCFTAESEPERLVGERQACLEVVAELTGAQAPVKTVLERVLGIWQPAA
ncbi:hypothetical protein [Saccharothrix sp. NRRL B-16314]|uniref:hypothetical protein n=1 Tax=Saccharothrix sp. NRRL B-16314 TaxID=1463825 RepID=UPI000B1AC0ED|nr:hypothetical protein [Saccharothrix sp. NRRL B-16314]